MELSQNQQFFDYLKKSQSILVALPQNLTVDALSAGMGLVLFLRKLGKRVELAGSGELPPVNLGFLPEVPTLVFDLSRGQQLVAILNTAERGLDELSYRSAGDKLEIYLKAKEGSFSPDDVSFVQRSGSYDLAIIIGASSPDELGALYQNHAELFFDLPKINLDIKPSNEYFGTINLIDVTASSLSEMLAVILSSQNEPQIDANVATCLLAGIIAATNSFQQPQTTPQSLSVAADLVKLGARQQEIIVSLFKTKDFSLLKLWGRALARLKTDEAHSLLYTGLNANDFVMSQTSPDLLIAVLREFIDNMSGYQTVGVMGELANGAVRLFLAAPPHVALDRIAEKLSGQPQQPKALRGVHQFIAVDLPAVTLAEAEAKLLEIMA